MVDSINAQIATLASFVEESGTEDVVKSAKDFIEAVKTNIADLEGLISDYEFVVSELSEGKIDNITLNDLARMSVAYNAALIDAEEMPTHPAETALGRVLTRLLRVGSSIADNSNTTSEILQEVSSVFETTCVNIETLLCVSEIEDDEDSYDDQDVNEED